jgi:hypothetical protein
MQVRSIWIREEARNGSPHSPPIKGAPDSNDVLPRALTTSPRSSGSLGTTMVFATVLSVLLAAARDCKGAPVEDKNATYHFTLMKGKGKAVCDAYLERLNAVDYTTLPEAPLSQPFCGLPENDEVTGFSKLNRVPLTLEERNRLLVNVHNFTHRNIQIPPGRVKEFFSWSLGKVTQPIWRYQPRLDIENSGMPVDVVVWQGWGAESGTGACGVPYPTSHGQAWRVVQQAYVLTADGSSVDEPKTSALFWTRSRSGAALEPIGQEVGILEFKGQYYFNAFSYGPRSFDSGQSNPKIADTLGVFLHKDGESRRICEYRMRDPELVTDQQPR